MTVFLHRDRPEHNISTPAWKKVVTPFTGSRENCKKLFLHLRPKLMRKKLYAKILLKNIENDNDNFEKGAIELE